MTVNLKKPTVEVVVINYRRQANIPLILRRFREQSYPCTVTLVDQGGGLSLDTYNLAHRVYTSRENYYSWNRYIFMGNYYRDYTYFHDDDMLPGVNVVRYFVKHAQNCPGGVLWGQHGHHFNGVAEEPEGFTPVKMLYRGYFIQTKYLYLLLKFSRHFVRPITEDDILLAWAIKTYTNKVIYVPPRPANASERMNERELDDSHACYKRPEHTLVRDEFWQQCEEVSRKIKSRKK